MHFHLPKPLHGWREFAGEVGIILLGVLLALLGQAMFEEWTWDRKVEAATSAMDDEIKRALADTLEADRTAKCGGAQLDFIQSKLIAKDWSVARAPVIWALYNRHFYGEDAYTSAVASQVAEHLGQDKLQKYAGLYTQIRKIRQHQEDGWSSDATFALLDIPDLPKTEAIQLEQLKALAKLRDSLDAIRTQGASLRQSAKEDLGLAVSADLLSHPSLRAYIAKCEAAAAPVRKLQAH